MSWLDSLEEIRKTDWSEAEDSERADKASEVVSMCAYAGGVTALVPVPLADLALLLPVHSVMVMTVGHIYGRPMSQTEAKRIALELGAVAGLSFAGTAAISALKRLVMPGLGGLLSVTATFALTWGLGRASMSYFQNPDLSREDLKKVFDDAMKEGKKNFSKDAFDRFRSKNEGVEVPEDESPESAPSDEPPKSEAPAEKPKPADPPDESLRPKKRDL